MADHGVEITEERLDKLADDLRKTYEKAQREMTKKLDSFKERHEREDQYKRQQLRDGKITETQYKDWLQGQVFVGKQWERKVDQLTETLLHANENAVSIIRDGQMDVYAVNANYSKYCIAKDFDFGVSFGLYSKEAVIRLLEDTPELLPAKHVNGEKDQAWNSKTIANCITQGIIQGETLPQVAKHIAQDTSSRNFSDMTRYARTAMTAAQNAGRIDAMHKAEDMGISVMKVWIATMDSRTRDAHADLNGIAVPVDDPFENEFGEIMYPGDPDAEEANVWNCRCTLGWEYTDYPSGQTRSYEEEFDEEEWEEYEEDYSERRSKEGEYADDDGRLVRLSDVETIGYGTLDEELTNTEIIDKVGRLDPTNGSCVSVAFAFIANKFGYDVQDFRGGDSEKFFSNAYLINSLAKSDGVKSTIIRQTNEFDAAKKLMDTIHDTKLYALSVGNHFAIVYKTKAGNDRYIELQTENNGFKDLNDKALEYRFGCSAEHKDANGRISPSSSALIEVDSLRNSDDFLGVLEYINTKKSE